jgi:hypothetical protein
MDIDKVLAELRAERELVEEAIIAVERITRMRGGSRRGRPPKWMAESKPRGRPNRSQKQKPERGSTDA